MKLHEWFQRLEEYFEYARFQNEHDKALTTSLHRFKEELEFEGKWNYRERKALELEYYNNIEEEYFKVEDDHPEGEDMKEDYPSNKNSDEEENNTLHVHNPEYEEVDEKNGIMQAHEPQEDLNSSLTFNKSIALVNWSKDSSNIMMMNDEDGSKGKRGNNRPTEGTLEPLRIRSEIDFKFKNSNGVEKSETIEESKREEPVKQLKLEENNTMEEKTNKYLGKKLKDNSNYEERGYEESYGNKEESDPTCEDSVENYHQGGNASALGRDSFGNMFKGRRYPNLSTTTSGTTPSSEGRNNSRERFKEKIVKEEMIYLDLQEALHSTLQKTGEGKENIDYFGQDNSRNLGDPLILKGNLPYFYLEEIAQAAGISPTNIEGHWKGIKLKKKTAELHFNVTSSSSK
eukprot:Gb_34828 [translate_table: standard]